MSEILVNSLKTAGGVGSLTFDSTGDVLLTTGRLGRVAGNTITIDSSGNVSIPSLTLSTPIDSDAIGNGAVTANKIASGSVGLDALSDTVKASLNIPLTVLVVAGGGSGAYDDGGGGGAGGLVFHDTATAGPGTSYTVTVGAGGATGTDNTVRSGNNSVFGAITAIAGGGGGSQTQNPASGGSGGGARRPTNTTSVGASGTQTNSGGGTGFGNNGGNANTSGTHSGGGGGAGEAGNTDGIRQGGDGRDYSSTFGSSVGDSGFFAGGGAGNGGNVTASGGQGGGGGTATATHGTPGTANTGGGGGAGGDGGGNNGGAGGSGVVIVRYPTSYTITVGAGLTSSTSVVNGLNQTVFTAGTDTISFG